MGGTGDLAVLMGRAVSRTAWAGGHSEREFLVEVFYISSMESGGIGPNPLIELNRLIHGSKIARFWGDRGKCDARLGAGGGET
jgi:hypothetical protein